jgi:hypothetical protein
MAHAYTAVLNGRDIYRFINIPRELINRRILVTIDPVENEVSPATETIKKLFADARKIKIPKKIRIESLTEDMNDALS